MTRLRQVSYFLISLAMPLVHGHGKETPGQVRPPRWSQDVKDAFFDDARDQLVGDRPQQNRVAKSELPVASLDADNLESTAAPQKWSALVDADTLTTEVKRRINEIGVSVAKAKGAAGPADVSSCRDFALLSVWFGIIADFDREMRWQRSAALMQSHCLETSQLFQQSAAQRFQAAERAVALLGDLFRGQAPAGELSKDQADRSKLVDRAVLMQGMELIVKERIAPAISNPREFRRRAQLAAEQAQLLAALAQVIQRAGYEYADDDTYLDEARQLRDAARALSEASGEKNYEAARAAAANVGQSCSRCHEGYRA